jgi:hypothetical protein
MRPPCLWVVYCGILKVPPRLQMVWWAALWRSPRVEARTVCAGFQRLSTQRLVSTDFLREQAGPAPMVRLLEACVHDRLVSRGKANEILEAMLNFTVVEATEDWRGVAIPSQRWKTEKEQRYGQTTDQHVTRAGV